MVRVLFVCLGNICRSPMAEAVFADLAGQAGAGPHFEIDSAGTAGYHIGQKPCAGTLRVLKRAGLTYRGRARRVTTADLTRFDYLVGLDTSNRDDLLRLLAQNNLPPKAHRLLDFTPEIKAKDVPDMYYHGNFDGAFNLILAGCRGLLAHITEAHNLMTA